MRAGLMKRLIETPTTAMEHERHGPESSLKLEFDEMITSALLESYNDGAGACNSTAVKWWLKFCNMMGPGVDPIRIFSPNAPVATLLQEEWFVMQFVS